MVSKLIFASNWITIISSSNALANVNYSQYASLLYTDKPAILNAKNIPSSITPLPNIYDREG